MRRFVLVLAAVLAGCREKPGADGPHPSPPSPSAAVPVQVAPVTRATLAEIVSGPGRTAALAQQKIRAPFAGMLIDLSVADGDHLRRGDSVGTIVSRDSEAALSGAREMAREAKTDAEKLDAARAITLAERSLVRATVSAPADGTVLSHAAARGDRVSEDQEILTIADASSIAFLADVSQSDLSRVRSGQPVVVEVAGEKRRLAGTVHDVLPGANTADFTASVRVDLVGLAGVPPLGLFGTARITVGEHRNAAVVPDAAIIRDDLAGTSRIALVEDGKARWIDVSPGLRGAAGTEILAPPLSAGQQVVVLGQVGLADGTAVVPRP